VSTHFAAKEAAKLQSNCNSKKMRLSLAVLLSTAAALRVRLSVRCC